MATERRQNLRNPETPRYLLSMVFNWSTIIATYGAILSTALGGLKLFELRRDRPRVVVSFTPGAAIPLEGEPRIYCTVGVVNTGRRPVTVKCIALQLKDGQTLVPGTRMYSGDLPATLNESEEVHAYFRREEVVLEQVVSAFAKTSDGKLHRSPRYKPTKTREL